MLTATTSRNLGTGDHGASSRVEEEDAYQRRESRNTGHRWAPILCNGLTVLGLAWAAAYTSTHSTDHGVGIAAWVAVAVVGTASSIAAARPRRREVIERELAPPTGHVA